MERKKLSAATWTCLLGGLAAAVVGVGFVFAGTAAPRPVRTAQDDLDEGGFYMDQGEYANALICYQDALEKDGTSTDALRGTAQAYEAMEYTAQAVEAYTQLTAQPDATVDDWLALIELTIQNGDPEGARTIAEQALPQDDSGRVQAMVDQMNPAAPQFNYASGSYASYLLLEVTAQPENATVYYTLDGSDPTTGSLVYRDGIVISAPSTTVKACAVSPLGYRSEVVQLDFFLTVPVQEILAGNYGPVAQALRYNILDRDDYDAPIYNYEAAQVRELYLVGIYTGDDEPMPVTFYANRYVTYGTNQEYYRGDGDLTGIEYMPFLRTLVVAFQDDLSLQPLTGLHYLEELSLLNDGITDITPLAGLSNLKRLALGWNNITDVSALGGLTGLTSLGLWNNQISDIGALGGLIQLTYLDIANNQVSSIQPVSGMSQLTSFWCNGNRIGDLSPLDSCSNLNILMQTGNPVTNYGAWGQNAGRLRQTDLTMGGGQP